VNNGSECPGAAAIYSNECTQALGPSKACCGESFVSLPPTDCCSKGFNLIHSEECSGAQALYVDECTNQYPGKVCCGESFVDTPGSAVGGSGGESCCDEGFELVASSSECPGDRGIALNECAKKLGKVCCTL
jgi:hypothetical protein